MIILDVGQWMFEEMEVSEDGFYVPDLRAKTSILSYSGMVASGCETRKLSRTVIFSESQVHLKRPAVTKMETFPGVDLRGCNRHPNEE